jgi:hypothetical protein
MPKQSSERHPLPTPPSPPCCQECPAVWRDDSRWRAYVTERKQLVFYCADCAEREFDSPLWRSHEHA